MALLKVGDYGKAVGDAQQLLIEAGEKIDQGELRQAFFGASTKIAVLDFQSTHLDDKNKPLLVDGVIGPVTLAALQCPHQPVEIFIMAGWRGETTLAPNPDAMSAAMVAIGELGTKEEPNGSNRGPRVDMYEGADYLGDPWCALFVSWCWGRAPGGSPFGIKASALKIRDWGAQSRTLLGGSDPLLPGDIAIILRAQGRGHVGIIVSTEHDGKISLIEGNCGNAVRATVRDRGFWSHFVRPRR